MPKVKFIRSSEYMNRLRDYGIYLDNKKVGHVSDGETMELEIPPGVHSVYAKIDWCYSPTVTFDITGDDCKTFNVSGFKGGKWMMPAGFFLLTVYYGLSFFFKIDSSLLLILVIPIFFALTYFITFGRRKYLTLQ